MSCRKYIHFLCNNMLVLCLCLVFFYFPLKNNTNIVTITKDEPKTPVKTNIFIDVDEAMLYLFKDTQLVIGFPCAVGKEETPSPLGTFTVILKEQWGSHFGGYWMGLNVPWGTYGIHGTLNPNSIGLAVSHGCIRLQNQDAKTLYDLIEVGTSVIIVKGEYGVFGSGLCNIEYEMSGAAIYAVQLRLRELGFYTKTPNGIFDEAMLLAFHQYEREQGIEETRYIAVWHLNLLGFTQTE